MLQVTTNTVFVNQSLNLRRGQKQSGFELGQTNTCNEIRQGLVKEARYKITSKSC